MTRRSAGWLPRRGLWVIVHRWAGLTIALFLIVAGVTGAVLPFEQALTFASRPDAAHAAPPVPGAQPLDGIEIARRIERATGAMVSYTVLDVPRDRVVQMFVAPRPGAATLAYDVVWADPYTGAIRLRFRWGGVSDGIVNLVPFLYSLHYGIVAGPWGVIAFGIAALVWTIDCFVGAYLTFPVRRVPHRDTQGWLARWRPAWRVRHARGYKLVFDVHRASGLWLWPLLFVFAWSGVALTLPQVEAPVMRLFGATAETLPPPLPAPVPLPAIAPHDAARRAEAALRAEGMRRSFAFARLTLLHYDPATAAYAIYARTGLDPTDADGGTLVRLDGRDGRLLAIVPPTGRSGADAFVRWIEYLHMARVFGLPWRIATSLIGLLVTALTVTGVLIWLRKRSARLLGRTQRRPAAARSRARVTVDA